VAIEGLSIRLSFDHNAHPRFARDLRLHGFDAVAAVELGHEAFRDEEHLRWATTNGRTLFTYDKADFSIIADDWLMRGEAHAGIILSKAPPLISYGEILRRLLRLLDEISAEEMVNRIEWLDRRWSAQTKNEAQ
jgi:predicted nuclease of predicted toxin-antitoxin system